jgi:hypothetical protein
MRKIAAILLMVLVLFQSPAVFAEETLEQQIAVLPSVEEFKAMSQEEQVDVYNRTQYAYEAYMALPTAEEKAALEGAEEKFDALFSHFNTMIMPLEPVEEAGKVSYNQFIWVVLLAVTAVPVVSMMRKKRR